MLNKSLYISILLFFFLSLTSALAQTVVWDESTDGDLPANGNYFVNTLYGNITLVDGVNLIKGSVGNASGNGSDLAIDALSFTVPLSASVTDISFTTFTLQNGNVSSLIVGYSGTPLSLINSSNYTTTGSLVGNIGSVPLGPGEYGIYLGEGTIEGTVYEISITLTSSGGNVPTLSEWGLIILALLLMTLGTLYLVQWNWRKAVERE